MRQRVFDAWGIQTGPFAAHSVHFVLKSFNIFFTFILGSHFLLPRGNGDALKRQFALPETVGAMAMISNGDLRPERRLDAARTAD